VRAHRTHHDGWFGVKIHHHHLRRVFLDQGRDPIAWLGDPRWIWIQRRDKLAQAISWARALQTGRWASHQRGLLPPIYRRAHIQGRLDAIHAAEVGWSSFFESHELTPLRIDYEDLVQHRETQILRALSHLGAEPTSVIPAHPILSQTDHINARWRARFSA